MITRIVIMIFLLSSLTISGQIDSSLIKDIESLIEKGDETIFSDRVLSIPIYEEALKKSIDNNLKKQEGEIYIRKAIISRIETEYDEAINYNLRALSIFEELKDTAAIANVYHNIGYAFRTMKNYDEAEIYFKKAIPLRLAIQDSTETANSLRELGVVYRNQNRYDEAVKVYEQALSLYDPEEDARQILRVQGNFAALYTKMGEYDQSIEINKSALHILKKLGEVEALSIRYSNIARAYESKKEYTTALIYVDSSMIIARDANLKEALTTRLKQKSRVLEKMRNFDEALSVYKDYKALEDSVFNISKLEEVTRQLTAYEFEKKRLLDSIKYEHDLAIKQKQISTEKYQKWIFSGIALLIISGLSFFALWIRNRNSFNKEKARSKSLENLLLAQELENKEKETQRLLEESNLRFEFKKSLIEKLEKNIDSNKNDAKTSLNLIKRELEDQIRHESQSSILNENIEKQHAAFEEYLRTNYPALTKNERKVCSLIRSGLSIKEIASIRESSSAAVQTMRSRIRKKLNVPKGDELTQFLEQLF